MLVRALKHRIEVLQTLAHLQCHGRIGDVVQSGLVVLVDQHHGTLAGFFMRQRDEFVQLAVQALMGTRHAQALLVVTEDF